MLEDEEQFADQLKEYYSFGDSLRSVCRKQVRNYKILISNPINSLKLRQHIYHLIVGIELSFTGVKHPVPPSRSLSEGLGESAGAHVRILRHPVPLVSMVTYRLSERPGSLVL